MKIKVFDFDKTIYTGDATVDFYIYCLKKDVKLIRYLPCQVYGFIMYILGIWNKVQFKQAFFSFLKGIREIEEAVEQFWDSHCNKMSHWYVAEVNHVVISASPEFLLQPVCDRIGVPMLIASKVDAKNGIFEGENCYGQEKVERLNQSLKGYVIEEFYSDSLSDTPLAKLAEKSYIVDKDKTMKWEDYKIPPLKKLINMFFSKQFILFVSVGIINTFNGVVCSYLYSKWMNPNKAFVMGYLTSLVISYILNSKVVFKEQLRFNRLIRFCISYIPNFMIQNVVVIIGYNILQLHQVIVYIMAAALGIPITFIVLKLFAFAKANKLDAE